jgi:hypothetical protein
MKTFNIRVRAEYVNQYTIEAEDLNQAEAIAQQNTYEEMDTNWEFGSDQWTLKSSNQKINFGLTNQGSFRVAFFYGRASGS